VSVTGGAAAWTCKLGTGFPVDDALRREWAAVADATANVFATWEWHDTWWRHFGHGGEPLVTTCRRPDGGLVAILPLYLDRRRPVRLLRFMGHGPGDELGPICSPEDRPRAMDMLGRSLAASSRSWDIFLGEALPVDPAWGRLLGARVLRTEGSPRVTFDATSWDEFLAGRSANLREQVRGRERRLTRAGKVVFRLSSGPDFDRDLGTLFALHAARWGRGTRFAHDEPFHREFAAIARDRGWARLWMLELDDRPVAAWYGFRLGDVEAYYQGGWDPGATARSVGFVLLAHTMRVAMEEGVREYRFLRGDEHYKYRFATADPGLSTVALSRGLVGGGVVLATRMFAGSGAFRRVARGLLRGRGTAGSSNATAGVPARRPRVRSAEGGVDAVSAS
jgi:CelD/BcsL family acetyltransferase involved in cellulose biosynthesis